MFKADKLPIYLFTIVGILFISGLYTLFSLRFQVGDVYPEYSSLRSDPLGTKVFYQSLANLEGLNVTRNHRPISRLIGTRYITLFLIGLDDYWMDMVEPHTLNALSGLAASGGRLVISFYPSQKVYKSLSTDEDSELESDEDFDDKEDADTEEADEETEGLQRENVISLSDKWGVRIGYSVEQERGTAHLAPTSSHRSLSSSITCHTTQFFIMDNDSWNVIYAQDGRPVLIEKKFGAGTIVLYADTFVLSNEAMMSERHPALLAWFVGKGREIIFDESHFGIRESMGIATLGRKYGLQGLFLVLLALAGLFIWKNAVPFIPPDDIPQITGKDAAPEKDYNDGLVRLLQRNITPKDIMAVCVKEWEKSVAQGKDFLQAKVKKIREIMQTPESSKHPVNTYRAINKIISERKWL